MNEADVFARHRAEAQAIGDRPYCPDQIDRRLPSHTPQLNFEIGP
jgi:hypothetical protein